MKNESYFLNQDHLNLNYVHSKIILKIIVNDASSIFKRVDTAFLSTPGNRDDISPRSTNEGKTTVKKFEAKKSNAVFKYLELGMNTLVLRSYI